MARYISGQCSKKHLKKVQEICDLRHLYAMPCQGCVYEGQYDCPKKQDEPARIQDYPVNRNRL
jgi:hypothetical protein